MSHFCPWVPLIWISPQSVLSHKGMIFKTLTNQPINQITFSKGLGRTLEAPTMPKPFTNQDWSLSTLNSQNSHTGVYQLRLGPAGAPSYHWTAALSQDSCKGSEPQGSHSTLRPLISSPSYFLPYVFLDVVSLLHQTVSSFENTIPLFHALPIGLNPVLCIHLFIRQY